MRKYGNANYERTINEKGDTIVSNVPITKEMEKSAAEVLKNSDKARESKEDEQELININDREDDER